MKAVCLILHQKNEYSRRKFANVAKMDYLCNKKYSHGDSPPVILSASTSNATRPSKQA